MKGSLILKILGGTFLTVVIGFIGWAVNIMDVPSWIVFRHLSIDLQGARSVTLREYAWDTTLGQRTATADEIDRLKQIAGKWPRPFLSKGALCFEPHHDIKITRADGSGLTISICFLCGNILYCDGPKAHPHPIPTYVEQPLRAFFASIEMKPKSLEEYNVYGPGWLKKDTQDKSDIER